MARIHLIEHVDLDNCYWGMATSIFFNGCPHKCIGCWNPITHDIDDNLYIDNDSVVEETLFALDEFGLKKDLSLLGGDPLAPSNIEDTIYILSKIKEQRPETKVLCWTGYRWEQLVNNKFFNRVLPFIDILIDGKYEKELHIEGHKFGSSNQKVVDVKQSLLYNSKVEANENYEE